MPNGAQRWPDSMFCLSPTQFRRSQPGPIRASTGDSTRIRPTRPISQSHLSRVPPSTSSKVSVPSGHTRLLRPRKQGRMAVQGAPGRAAHRRRCRPDTAHRMDRRGAAAGGTDPLDEGRMGYPAGAGHSDLPLRPRNSSRTDIVRLSAANTKPSMPPPAAQRDADRSRRAWRSRALVRRRHRGLKTSFALEEAPKAGSAPPTV
jgi:hypothetical protein